jgi:hypothetical protein
MIMALQPFRHEVCQALSAPVWQSKPMMLIVCKLFQPLNANSFKAVTLAGIVILFKFLQ